MNGKNEIELKIVERDFKNIFIEPKALQLKAYTFYEDNFDLVSMVLDKQQVSDLIESLQKFRNQL